MSLRLLSIGVAVAAGLGFAVVGPGGAAHPACVEAAAEHHVAIVVEHGGGATLRRCVAFADASISGEAAMNASGIEYRTSSYGGGLGDAVCQVDYEPATYPPGCWTSTSPYWAMFVSRGGSSWAVSQRGISSLSLQDGDALGWHYVPQSGPGGGPPPSPAGVCAAALPPPAAAGTAAAPAAPAAVPSIPGTTVEASPPGSSGPLPAATAAAPVRSADTAASAIRRNLGPTRVDPGILAASLAGGALAGLLLVQLVSTRLRP